MAAPREKLAQALEALKALQDLDIVAIKKEELSRIHRERLIRSHFLKEVIKGWFIATPEDEQYGDSTTWYTSYWGFCTRYLEQRFSDGYCLSADQSLLLHAGNRTVPHQLIVRSTSGSNSITPLPFNTSLFSMKSQLPNSAEIIEQDGLFILSLPSSLIHCSPSIFSKNPTDVRTALSQISDSSEIIRLLIENGHSTIAGRLAGAFRNTGQVKIATDILSIMKSAGYDVRENDPFGSATPVKLSMRDRSPYVNRIRLMWNEMREVVIRNFPIAPGIPQNKKTFLLSIEEQYVTDAYHSLSIEKYKVSSELIERVRQGAWNPKKNKEDQQHREAMAARGYWQSTLVVMKSIERILQNENAGEVANDDHGLWYRELWAPSVLAGLIKASDLAGYRNNQVYIGSSKHVPLNVEAVRDAMPELMSLLSSEPEASVRAVLGHFIFVYIHPYSDGNGRLGRFLMNVMLCSGGYPWTIIPVEQRTVYMAALEKASVDLDIEPLAKFIAMLVVQTQKGTPLARRII
jgi:hypothetical protein